jgi:hypothetical protein
LSLKRFLTSKLTFQSRHLESDVTWIVEELFVVGADVNDAGKNSARMEAAGRDVEVELADGNPEATDAEITETQNSEMKRKTSN